LNAMSCNEAGWECFIMLMVFAHIAGVSFFSWKCLYVWLVTLQPFLFFCCHTMVIIFWSADCMY
jgi:hypothetical protein